MQYQRSPFAQIPQVTKNLIIINALVYFATYLLQTRGIDLTRILGLYYPASEYFRPFQFVTHMFMHGGIGHLFFNMFALYMFGRVLESVWGPKRFLIFYFVTGLGAAALHSFVNYLEIAPMAKAVTAFSNTPTPELFSTFINKYQSIIQSMGFSKASVMEFAAQWHDQPASLSHENEAISFMSKLVNARMNIPTVGASGAVFGVLLGFGMLFPNTQLMLLFPPIPIKAKYFVIGYGALELILGLSMPGSNVAHFAHLGGMIFGFMLIKYWNSNRTNFY
ncbi:rhomboid family intramembrane serine protease [Roseimarinus sediminis]|jgi:membrane associated rhomboid family serine protease|uniref:rhomboid family intramembrane serine protease n=1 Tax=Roseimarinus sediminis TaxID=1610899 RepID=UPI003D24E6E1